MGWDLVRSAQASSPALRTARDVLAGQAQEELLPVLTRERRRGFRSDVEQLAAERLPEATARWSAASSLARNTVERMRTARKKFSREGIQRWPLVSRPPPGTMQCRWG